MSNETMHILITKMHIRLNKLIESNDYDLLSKEVQHYSRRLDRVLLCYSKSLARTLGHARQDEAYLKEAVCNYIY